jgi:hypothetical protein
VKSKELMALVLFGIVLAVVGTLLIGKLSNEQQRHTAEIEVVTEINPEYNEEARNILLGKDETFKVQAYDPTLTFLKALTTPSPSGLRSRVRRQVPYGNAVAR